jgi:CRP-like cAMP-binding protein
MLINEKLLTSKIILPKTLLVKEGAISEEIFFIKQGSIRAWYNAEGADITLQFFFEGDSVTALESFLNNVPSNINIETLEQSEVYILKKSDFLKYIEADAVFKDWFYKTAIEKLLTHTNRLLSLLRHKPFNRYQELLSESPLIFQRIPQHYIASYLGITPVSLSRIRNRKVPVS